jgi:hypothetical protein
MISPVPKLHDNVEREGRQHVSPCAIFRKSGRLLVLIELLQYIASRIELFQNCSSLYGLKRMESTEGTLHLVKILLSAVLQKSQVTKLNNAEKS